MLPCHSPVVKPPRTCGAFFDGCWRPSIQIVCRALSSQAPIFRATVVPVTGSISFQMPVYLLAATRELEQATGGHFARFTALYWLLRRLDPLVLRWGR